VGSRNVIAHVQATGRMSGKARARDIAKQETREALIRAGLEVFAEEGVDLPSLDGICARAGFTRGAFYVHFKDREDFLAAVVDRVLTDFVNWVISTGETQGGLVGVIDRFFTLAREGKFPFTDRQRLLMQLVSRGTQAGGVGKHPYKGLIEEAVSRLAAAVREGQGQAKLKRDLEPEQTAVLLAAAAVGFIALLDAGYQPNFDPIRRQVDALFFEPSKKS
jgi:TetR/AcrR family transcriptional regulator, transcriptional repressor for nem operon